MSLSARGAFLSVRPALGRTKRAVLSQRRRLSPSGEPSSTAVRPTGASRATLQFLAGLAVERAGDPAGAIARYRTALELDPRFSRRWIRLATLLRRAGSTDEAVHAYRQAVEWDPEAAEALLWLALAQVDPALLDRQDGRPHDAVANLAAASEMSDGQFLFLRALFAECDDRAETARDLYVAAIETDPDNDGWLLAYARFETDQQQWAAAADAFRRATLGDTDDRPRSASPTPSQLLAEFDNDDDRAADDDWAAVAAAGRLLLDADPDDPNGRRLLGLGLFRLGQWAEAEGALDVAVGAFPTDLVLVERLATAAARNGNHERAIEARERAALLSPTAIRFLQLALALQRGGRYEQAVAVFDRSIRLGTGNPHWFNRFGGALRETKDWVGAALLYRSATERFPEVGYLWYYLGYALEHVADLDGAEAAYRRAVSIEPSAARWWYRLGYLHERFGPPRTHVAPRLGLRFGPTGDPDTAAELYRTAVEIDPKLVEAWRRLGGVQEQLGEFEQSRVSYRRAVELAPEAANVWHLLGRSIAAAANERGVYHQNEHDEIESIWGRAIELEPMNAGSRDQLVRASIKAARWDVADSAAWFPPPPINSAKQESVLRRRLSDDASPSSTDDLRSVLDLPADELLWVPRNWWFTLHWKLLSDNDFSLAYRAKELMAHRVIHDGTGGPAENLAGHLEHARALVFLGEQDRALESLTPSLVSTLPPRTREVLAKHAADVEFLSGNAAPYTELLDQPMEPHIAATEDAFRELISGRSVAVVGPALSESDHGHVIDQHDVVIRTKFIANQLADFTRMAGARTDVSYYALGSAQFLKSDIKEALTDQHLKMAVFRTGTYTAEPRFLVRPGDVRYVPSEYGIGFRSSPFAIQRIIYDVLRYQPSSLNIFNIDFFLTKDSYRPGYVTGYIDDATQHGFVKVLGSFGHDYRADFEFTRRMSEYGWIGVDARIEEILRLTPEGYLAALDRRDPSALGTDDCR